MNFTNITISGLSGQLSDGDLAVWRSRFDRLTREYLSKTGESQLNISISTNNSQSSSSVTETNTVTSKDPKGIGSIPVKKADGELSKEERAEQYKTRDPYYSFDFLIVPEQVKNNLLAAVNLIRLESKIFDHWNLRKIEPFPRAAINLHGDPGTGKTLAAHCLANYLKQKILVASYAQIESKYHGDGPKNVEALFYAAERDNAVLFIDEADSLLSKRLTNVSQGSEQAINSMRSQLLICLEQFRGIVIFATNLVTNYDRAFETRVRNVYFPLPDEICRKEIWQRHLMFEGGPPLDSDISIDALAKISELCGRDIKNAVIDAALRAVQDNRSAISQTDLIMAIETIKTSRIDRDGQDNNSYHPASPDLTEKVLKALDG